MKSNNIRDSPPPLRDYQQADLAKMQNYEGRAALMVLATGLGKTRMQLIQNRGGISAIQVRNLSDTDKAVLFGRLVNEERLGFAQLSRLTGISKGEIKRLLLQMEDDL